MAEPKHEHEFTYTVEIIVRNTDWARILFSGSTPFTTTVSPEQLNPFHVSRSIAQLLGSMSDAIERNRHHE